MVILAWVSLLAIVGFIGFAVLPAMHVDPAFGRSTYWQRLYGVWETLFFAFLFGAILLGTGYILAWSLTTILGVSNG